MARRHGHEVAPGSSTASWVATQSSQHGSARRHLVGASAIICLIASGVIEGACRHLVKDRLERAGMHWTVEGAQAMLDLRSVWIAGQWEAFQQHRIERDRERLYPHRDLVAGEAFFALAP